MPAFVCLLFVGMTVAGTEVPNHRTPANDAELRYWLENMIWHHRFTTDEIRAATGLAKDEIAAAVKRLGITEASRPKRAADAPLLVLPYPGGRHPRIGFRDGAVRPQRETKISVFTPWDDTSYVVVDVPEAIWSNLGLTYLAHTHVPTVWTKQNVELEKLEWSRREDGAFDIERKLPNGIAFGTKIMPAPDHVAMEMWLTNGTKQKLTDLRVQMCALLGGAKGFEQQDNENKVFRGPYAAAGSRDGKRWIIMAWTPPHRTWGNPPCPCLHSDPKFPDCEPGATQRIRGRLWFFEGVYIDGELKRLQASGWRQAGAERSDAKKSEAQAIQGDWSVVYQNFTGLTDDRFDSPFYSTRMTLSNGKVQRRREPPANQKSDGQTAYELTPRGRRGAIAFVGLDDEGRLIEKTRRETLYYLRDDFLIFANHPGFAVTSERRPSVTIYRRGTFGDPWASLTVPQDDMPPEAETIEGAWTKVYYESQGFYFSLVNMEDLTAQGHAVGKKVPFLEHIPLEWKVSRDMIEEGGERDNGITRRLAYRLNPEKGELDLIPLDRNGAKIDKVKQEAVYFVKGDLLFVRYQIAPQRWQFSLRPYRVFTSDQISKAAILIFRRGPWKRPG